MPGYHKLRLPEQYRAMLGLDTSGFAWEWLRRNPDFRAVWAGAGAAAHRASARAAVADRRVIAGVTELARHPLAERTVPWGLSFSPHPDTPATDHPLIGWSPETRTQTMSLVRPLPWARTVPGLLFEPERWGPGVFRLEAPGGDHLIIRRHGSPELALWLPVEFAPREGEPFGFYLHADRHHADRIRCVNLLRRQLESIPPRRRDHYRNADRQVAMLCVYDLNRAGAQLRDIAEALLESVPCDWRMNSRRSDLRRLVEDGSRMAAGAYRTLLNRCDTSNGAVRAAPKPN